MRVLVVHPAPSFSVADVFTGWVEGLREQGCTVSAWNLDDRLALYDSALREVATNPDGTKVFRKFLDRDQVIKLATNGLLSACYQFWPDVVLVISGFFIPGGMLDLIRSRRQKVVVVHTEEPYEHTRELALAEHADLNVLNDPVNLDAYRAVAPAAYIPHAYRPALHHPGAADPKLACDFAFVGTAFPSRIEFLERMDLRGLDVFLAGNWQLLPKGSPLHEHLAHPVDECLDNEQAVQVYRSARAGLNLYRREAETAEQASGWALSPREVEMAACGLFFLRDPRGEGDRLLPALPTFTGPEDAGEQLRWWLTHDMERKAAARLARDAVADRTFANNAAALLRLLDRQPVTAR